MIFITDPKCATLFYFASTLQNPKNFYRAEDSRLGKEFLDLINIFKVNCDDVNLTPSLLKKIKK